MMDREFTPREKGMLLVLAVLLLALGYMKLFYAPVQQAVEDNQQRQTELQDQALIEQTRALKMQEGAGGAEGRKCRARRPGPRL